MTYKYVFSILFCLFGAAVVQAQHSLDQLPESVRDSVIEAYLDRAAFKNPVLRQASFLADVHGSSRLTSRLNDKKFITADVLTVRYFGKFSVPVYHQGKNLLAADFGLRYETFKVSDVRNYNSDIAVEDQEFDKAIINVGGHYTRLDTAFSRPLALSVVAGGMIDPHTGQSRFTATVVTLMTLMQTRNFSLSAGVLLSIEPIAPSPVIPFVSIYKKFGDSGYEFTLDPAGIALIKSLNERSTLSFSNRVDGSLALFQFNNPQMPSAGVFSSLEVKSGLTYERLIGRKTVLTFSSGLSSVLNSRVLEKGKSMDPFIQNKQRPMIYGQFGVSFLPFWKGLASH